MLMMLTSELNDCCVMRDCVVILYASVGMNPFIVTCMWCDYHYIVRGEL